MQMSPYISHSSWRKNWNVKVLKLHPRLNLPLPYQAYGENELSRRYGKQFSQILNSLSHYVFSCLFRVSCLAFMWIYLAFYAAIPILVLLFINILIFYTQESDKGK